MALAKGKHADKTGITVWRELLRAAICWKSRWAFCYRSSRFPTARPQLRRRGNSAFTARCVLGNLAFRQRLTLGFDYQNSGL